MFDRRLDIYIKQTYMETSLINVYMKLGYQRLIHRSFYPFNKRLEVGILVTFS